MESASERILWICNYFGTNANDVVARYRVLRPKSKITKQAIYNIMKQRTKNISSEISEVFITVFPEINREWLITGEGARLIDKRFSGDFLPEERTRFIGSEAKQVSINNYLKVPMIPVYAHAGFLAGYGDTAYWDGLPKELWEVDKEYKGNYVVFEVKGDSMNDESVNSILDGDKILCRELPQIHWTAKLHLNKYYFVIVHREEGIIVKKIIDHNPETGDIVAHSLNPLYEDLHLNLRDVVALYNVVDLKRKPLV